MKKMKGFLMLALTAVGTLLTACDDELDVKQAYAFRLETMPVQTRIVRGETAEIRCTLVRAGKYDGARYTIRFSPTTAIPSRGRCFDFTTPPEAMIDRSSTCISRITWGR